MEIINDTPFEFAPLSGRMRFPGHSLTMIVKGTFDLAPGAVASIAKEQLPVTGDEPYPDDAESAGSIRYASDFAYAKPRADLLLVGACHPPNGEAATACRTTFRVGDKARSLAVFGHRDWSATQAVPFERMELRYENSFGGEGYQKNPVGKGIGPIIDEQQRRFHPIPNIEDYEDRISSQDSRPEPAGFGPIPAGWEQRSSKAGTYKRDYKDTRWPWFPEDFDWGYFNAAPRAMQLDGFLKGDEPLLFEHLDPEVADFKAKLPGVRARCFVKTARTERYPPEFSEVPLALDTLWVDMEARRLVLVWRGWTDVEMEDYPEIDYLYVAAEYMDEEPGSIEFHNKRLKQRLAEIEAAWEPEIEEPGEGEEDTQLMPIRKKAASGDDDDSLIDEELAKIRQTLIDAGVDPDKERVLSEEEKKEQQRMMKEIGFMDDETDAQQTETPAPKLTRQAVQERLSKGESLEGEDMIGLDLSGLDMHGASMERANLEDANLEGSLLAGANLSGANLKGARLKQADLQAANLVSANLSSVALMSANLGDTDLTGCRLTGADLSGCRLDDALLERASLELANLNGVSAKGTRFAEANLTGSSLKDGTFTEADFSAGTLERVNLQGADLSQATLEKVKAAYISMDGADLTGLRASESADFTQGSFRKAHGKESVWEGACLTGADLSGADMEGAWFGSANLEGASLHASNMKFARFPKANLTGANMTRMNLFEGSLEKARLSGADISGSNMYGTEFLDAVTEGLRGSDVNLKMTKLNPQ